MTNQSDNQPMPAFIDATEAIRMLRVSRTKFYDRVRKGIYLPAEHRAGDPPEKEKLYRPRDLVMSEFLRKHDELRTGIKT